MTYRNPSPDGRLSLGSMVPRPLEVDPFLRVNNSIYILYKSTFTMKNIVSLMMALCCSIGIGWAQLGPLSSTNYSTEAPVGYWLELEAVVPHSGGVLDGQTTYRLYMNMQNETDYMSSCSGDSDNPLILTSTTGEWYNNAAATTWNAQGLNPVFFAFFPELAYDSFLTIGADDATTPAAQHPSSVWGANDATAEFVGGPGNDITVDDATGGAWYTPYPGTVDPDGHVAFAGDDLRVLLAQFTTAGIINGQFQVQVFVEGIQSNEFRDLLPICSGDGECGGCTDELASNYDPDALYDDGNCLFASFGCTDASACNYDAEATEDNGSCEFPEDGFNCDGNCVLDIDCAGECGGDATEDALGVCGGDCDADADADGICDDIDDCVGVVDACGICNGPGAIYECGCADIAEGSCDCDGNVLDECGVCGGDGIAEGACDCDGNVIDALGVCGGGCAADADADGICDDEDDCVGAVDACGICNGPGEIYECGCSDIPAGDCDCEGTQLDAIGVCGGDCNADADADGICDDEDDCLDVNQNGTCDEDEAGDDCFHDSDDDGIVDCEDSCPFGDFDNDGICDVEDPCVGVVDVLGICNGHCFFNVDGDYICDDVDNCTNMAACNYNDPSNGECLFLDDCGVCGGPGDVYECGCADIPAGDCDCEGNQLDQCGVCGGDGLSCLGCIDAEACNYDETATIDDGSCLYNDVCGNCGGSAYEGCTDAMACNYDAGAGCDDASCLYLDECGECGGEGTLGCTDDMACNFDAEADCDDESCQYLDECGECGGEGTLGCTDEMACNFDAEADCDDDSCYFADQCGVCDGDGTSCLGCTDSEACNYDETATIDDSSCYFADQCGVCDGDGTSCLGCTDSEACNYDETATIEDETCLYNDVCGNCDGDAYAGCTDPAACNYDAGAGCDDGSCLMTDCMGNCGGGIFPEGCQYPESELYGRELEVFTECESGFENGSVVVLESNNTIVQYADGSSLVVGTWSYDECLCAAGMDALLVELYLPLDCEAFQLAVDGDGVISQSDLDECDCGVEIIDNEEYFCSTDFLDDLEEEVSVECAEDLPTGCDPEFAAADTCTDDILVCAFNDGLLGYTTYDVITAEGPGADAAIRIYGLSAQTDCLSDMFVEDEANPLTLTVFANGTARLTGVVHNDVTPSITYEVDMQFNHGQNAETWLAESPAHGLLTNWQCEIDPSAIDVYNMVNTISRLTRLDESHAGEVIFLNHMPVSLNKRFQLGVGGNNHNCNDGFGGWFGWEGLFNGEPVAGFSGDVIADVTNPVFFETFCGDEFVQATYGVFNIEENTAESVTQTFAVNDTQAPEFVSCPEDITVELSALECGSFDAIDAMFPVPCLEVTDNCANWDPMYEGCNEPENACGSVTFTQNNTQIDDCPFIMVVERQWVANDGFNTTVCSQTITVKDTEGPTFSANLEDTLSCDDLNEVKATADDCSGVVSLTFTQDLQSGTCSNPGSVSRTYTAIDGCGNVTSFDQILNVIDEEAPVVMASEFFVDCDEYSASTLYPLVITDCALRDWTEGEDGVWTSTFNENWSTIYDDISSLVEVEWTDSTPVLGEGTCYTVIRSVTATDNCGNATTVSYPINISDTTAPVITAAPVLNIECSAYLGDSFQGDDVVSYAVTAPSGNGVGSSVEISDESNDWFGQTSFQVEDDCTFNELYADGGGAVSVTWQDEYTEGETCAGAVYTRTYTATDACGNSASATQTVIIVDNSAPTWNEGFYMELVACEDATEALMNDASHLPLYEAMDNCDDDLEYTVSAVLTSGGCIGSWHRTWTAIDDCDNASQFEQTIMVYDSLAPEFVYFPGDTTIEVNSFCDANYIVEVTGGEPTAQDNCDICFDQNLEISYVETTSVDCGEDAASGSRTVTRTWTVTDQCGNATSRDQVITIEDNQAPSFNESLPGDMTLECAADDAAVLTASDNCSDVEVIFTADTLAGDCPNRYTVTRNWYVEDACGNSNSHQQIITVIDETAPIFNEELPQDMTLDCAHPEAAVLTAYDNCTDVTVEFEEAIEAGDCPNSYTVTRTWTAADLCGHVISHTQVITVIDETAPTGTAHTAFVDCAEYRDFPDQLFGDVEAMDNCDDDVTITWDVEADSLLEVNAEINVPASSTGCYTILRTYTLTDDCGNSTDIEQIIEVEDNTAPIYMGPGEISIPAAQYDVEGAYPPDVIWAYPLDSEWDSFPIGYIDDCSGFFSCTAEDFPISGGCANQPHPMYNGASATYLRVLTITDLCGNSSTAEVIINLVDEDAPVFDFVPEDYTVSCAEEVVLIDPIVSDLVDENLDVEYEEATMVLGCDNDYLLIRRWTVTDNCDNSVEAEQIITVKDEIAPSIDAAAQDMTIECAGDFSNNEALANWLANRGGAAASDNCDGDVMWSMSPAAPALSDECGNTGSVTVTYTATDICGNASSTTATFTVEDTTAPVITAEAADATIECGDYSYIVQVEETIQVEEIIQVEQEVIYEDEDGNEIIDIILVDQTILVDAIILVDSIITVTDAEEFAAWLENRGGATGDIDACGDVTWSSIPANPELSDGCGETGEVTVTWVLTDECGLTDSTTAIFTIEDTTNPEFTMVPADYTAECSDAHPLEMAQATDICGVVDITVDADTTYADCPSNYVVTRTFTATDACGNHANAEQVIIIQDTTAPEFTEALPGDLTLDCAADDAAVLTATDNCSDVEVIFTADTVAGDCPNRYEITRMWSVEDECGNNNSHTQVVTVVDETAPEFNEALPADVTLDCAADNAAVLTASDNCSDVEVIFTADTLAGDCPNRYTVTRLWSVTDECGNSASHTQVVIVEDETSPMLSNIPTELNNESIEVPYDTYCGEVTVPAIADVMASDFCSDATACNVDANAAANAMIADALGADMLGEDGHLDYLTGVTTSGINNPFVTGGSYTVGDITTPATLLDGETCDNNPNQHGMRMFNFAGGEYYMTDEGAMTKDHENGTATVTMMVSNDMGAFEVQATFGTLMNWEEWCATPGLESYKSDCGLGDHMTWEYAILLDGTITGVEGTAFEGTELTMSHQPANEYFGFQFGVGANNKNAAYGFSGWYYYGGTLVFNGEESSAMGSGDLFGDLDFLKPWETTFHYCAVDACGNDVTYNYSLTSTGDLQNPLLDGDVEGQQDAEIVYVKDLIEITTLHPNPASVKATLTVTVKQDLTVKVQVFTMDGSLVEHVFDGQMFEGWPTTLELNTNNYESGMYQVRVSSKDFVTTKKLLVIE